MSALDHTDVLPADALAGLVADAPWRRLVVVGDSIAAGVREPSPGFRDLSWVDRVVEPLRIAVPGFDELRLGERRLLAAQVRHRQLAPALAFRPDLAIVAAGGNDALRGGLETAWRELDAMVAPLRDIGADVILLELMDIVASGLVPRSLDAPLRRLAAVTGAVAARHGAILVPMRRHPASADPRIYGSDRLHLNARGHAIVGTETVRALGAHLATKAAA